MSGAILFLLVLCSSPRFHKGSLEKRVDGAGLLKFMSLVVIIESMKALKKCWGMGAVSYLKDLELSCCVRSAFQVGHLDFSKIHVLSKNLSVFLPRNNSAINVQTLISGIF